MLYGRRQHEPWYLVIGFALIVYPYFVTGVFLTLLIGALLLLLSIGKQREWFWRSFPKAEGLPKPFSMVTSAFIRRCPAMQGSRRICPPIEGRGESQVPARSTGPIRAHQESRTFQSEPGLRSRRDERKEAIGPRRA